MPLVIVISLGCSTDYVVPSHVPGVVRVVDEKVFAAYGDGGIIISDATTGQVISHIIPPREMVSIDDFDVADNLLFVLDARGQDYLAVYSIVDINNPSLVEGPIKVVGGPYNGISAKSGNIVVSGGSRFLEYFQYSLNGKLSGPATFGRDRGHPDVLLSDNGQVAFASTDFIAPINGARFGVIALSLGTELNIPGVISQEPIPEAGFSQGITSPVGFPIQVEVYGDHLLVAHGGGVTIIELVNQSGFGQSQLIDLGIEALNIVAENDVAYITGFGADPVLLKVDISDILNPIVIETVSLNIGASVPLSLSLSNQFIFIAAGEAGILKLDK